MGVRVGVRVWIAVPGGWVKWVLGWGKGYKA